MSVKLPSQDFTTPDELIAYLHTQDSALELEALPEIQTALADDELWAQGGMSVSAYQDILVQNQIDIAPPDAALTTARQVSRFAPDASSYTGRADEIPTADTAAIEPQLYTIRKGDTLSRLVGRELGIHWSEDPELFFAAVKALDDDRAARNPNATGVRPSPDQLEIGETVDLSLIETAEPDRAAVTWYRDATLSSASRARLSEYLQTPAGDEPADVPADVPDDAGPAADEASTVPEAGTPEVDIPESDVPGDIELDPGMTDEPGVEPDPNIPTQEEFEDKVGELDEAGKQELLDAIRKDQGAGAHLSEKQQMRLEQLGMLKQILLTIAREFGEEGGTWAMYFAKWLMSGEQELATKEKFETLASEKINDLVVKVAEDPDWSIETGAPDLYKLFAHMGDDHSIVATLGYVCNIDFKDPQSKGDLTLQRAQVARFCMGMTDYESVADLTTQGLQPEFDAAIAKIPEADKQHIHHEAASSVELQAAKMSDTWAAQGMKPEDAEAFVEMMKQEAEEKKLVEFAIKNKYFDPATLTADQMVLWDVYNETFDPNGEWFNMAESNFDFVVQEVLINAPLIIASGGVASLARAGLSRAAISFIEGSRFAAYVGEGALAATRAGRVLAYAGTASGLLTEGFVFELTHHGLKGEWLFNSPTWAQDVIGSAITLGMFKEAGKLADNLIAKKFMQTGLGKLEKITNSYVRKGIEELLIKGHFDVAAMMLMAASNNAYNGSMHDFYEDFGDLIFHSYVSALSLKGAGAAAEFTMKHDWPSDWKQTRADAKSAAARVRRQGSEFIKDESSSSSRARTPVTPDVPVVAERAAPVEKDVDAGAENGIELGDDEALPEPHPVEDVAPQPEPVKDESVKNEPVKNEPVKRESTEAWSADRVKTELTDLATKLGTLTENIRLSLDEALMGGLVKLKDYTRMLSEAGASLSALRKRIMSTVDAAVRSRLTGLYQRALAAYEGARTQLAKFSDWITGAQDKALKAAVKEEDAVIAELYPKGIDQGFKQGGIGVCFMLSALNGLKGTPKLLRMVIGKTVKKNPDGSWTVTFLSQRDMPIVVTAEKIAAWKAERGEPDIAPGDILLEVAYASLRSRRQHGRPHMTMMRDAAGRMPVEGGFGHRALYDFLGEDYAVKYKMGVYESSQSLADQGYGSDSIEQPLTDLARNPDGIIMTASTRPKGQGIDANDNIVNGRVIMRQHEYSVIGYDPVTKMVKLVDPHDTKKPFEMKLDEFNALFSQMSYVRVNELRLVVTELQGVSSATEMQTRLKALLTKGNLFDLIGEAKSTDRAQMKSDLRSQLISIHDSLPVGSTLQKTFGKFVATELQKPEYGMAVPPEFEVYLPKQAGTPTPVELSPVPSLSF